MYDYGANAHWQWGGGKWRYPEYWRSPRNVRNPMRYVSIRYRFMPLFIIFVHYAIRYHAILYYWRAGYSVSWRKLAADMLEFRSWGYLMSFWALALSFLFCGCFVSPCWSPLGVGRAARARWFRLFKMLVGVWRWWLSAKKN